MSADKAVVGLRHGGLTAEMVPLLTPGRSVLAVAEPMIGMQKGDLVTVFETRPGHWIPVKVRHDSYRLPVGAFDWRFTYIGERGEDGWIACPEGGWTSNPCPGRKVDVRTRGTGEWANWTSDQWGVSWLSENPGDGDNITAFRLSDQQAAEPASAPVGIREADEPKAPAYQGAQGEEIAALRAIRDALLEAGGANPGGGMVRFSFWSLDRLTRAFDLAALQHKEGR